MNEIFIIGDSEILSSLKKVCLICDLITDFSLTICLNCNSPLIDKKIE
jgi:hypothetical protein